MTEQTLRKVVFLSGKGGSGKTTVAISVAKLLSDMGYSCLLLDFDLATNGASYFFVSHLKHNTVGIWELIGQQSTEIQNKLAYGLKVVPNVVNVSDRFSFIPSRGRLGSKGPSFDTIKYEPELLTSMVLDPIIAWAQREGKKFLLIDCQAGYSSTSIAASRVADLAVMVAEADAVSSDAAENLLIQLGSDLPSNRRYLVNKLDVRDADTFRNLKGAFQSLNRLSPIPFDFSVRNAFGSRRLPINLDQPSSLLFALLQTVSEMLPEVSEELEAYKRRHTDALFQEYDNRLTELLREKKALEDVLVSLQVRGLESSYRTSRFLSVTIAVALVMAMGVVTAWIVKDQLGVMDEDLLNTALWTSAIVIMGMVGTTFLHYYRNRLSKKYEDDITRLEVSRKLADLTSELDRYRSLLLTRSKEYLVDYEISRSADHTPVYHPSNPLEK